MTGLVRRAAVLVVLHSASPAATPALAKPKPAPRLAGLDAYVAAR